MTAKKKWEAYVSTRYFSGSWGFDRFGQAIDWIRQNRKESRLDDPKGLTPFRAKIQGPGGELSWETLSPLVP